MTFGIEVVIPVEVGLSSMRTADFSSSTNDLSMTEQLDFVEENREITSISTKLQKIQRKTLHYKRKITPLDSLPPPSTPSQMEQ